MASKPETELRQIFVAWVPFQRRQASMAPILGIEIANLPIRPMWRFARPTQYLVNQTRTILLLRKTMPDVIWVQLPQAPLLSAALIYKRLFSPECRIVADCHNLILNPPWNRWPGLQKNLNACDAVVIHNHRVTDKVIELGVRRELIHLLEDPPAVISSGPSTDSPFPHPWVLFLASFNPDEPIAEIVQAARLAPDISFVIAGDLKRARRKHVLAATPQNVIFPGYLAGAQLDHAIRTTDAVLALTKLNDAQLSSAAEAIGAGRPMVLSDTPVTRDLYHRGGVFVDTSSPGSIVSGCRTAIIESNSLSRESAALRADRLSRWQAQANSLYEFMGIRGRPIDEAPI